MKKLRHVVLFKFKDGITNAEIEDINQNFSRLKEKINGLDDFEMGDNNSPEGISQGFTHGYLLTFLSEENREEYLHHPSHKLFQQLVDPKLELALAFDYWAA